MAVHRRAWPPSKRCRNFRHRWPTWNCGKRWLPGPSTWRGLFLPKKRNERLLVLSVTWIKQTGGQSAYTGRVGAFGSLSTQSNIHRKYSILNLATQSKVGDWRDKLRIDEDIASGQVTVGVIDFGQVLHAIGDTACIFKSCRTWNLPSLA